MPGDISKYTKYTVDLPYPEPMVEKKDAYYAELLFEDYSGAVSEMTAINLYVYQHIIGEGKYDDYAELIGGVAMAEMKHLELLGETIKLLGQKPIYKSSIAMYNQPWTASYINYSTNIKDMILEDIKSEQKAIENYKYHLYLIEDKYIRELINRIILDEKLHLKYFKEIYEKYQ
jgi:bacterioferritin